jgi:hypothetical protein
MSGDRFISQNALIKEIAKIRGNLNTRNVGQAIWDTPTADVVEVVRCRDCKYKMTASFNGDILIGCSNQSALLDVYDDGFCSYGERREE